MKLLNTTPKKEEEPGFTTPVTKKTLREKGRSTLAPTSSNAPLNVSAEELQKIRQQNTPTNEGR